MLALSTLNPEVLRSSPDTVVFNGDWLTKASIGGISQASRPVEPLTAQLNPQLVKVMGDHDNRAALQGPGVARGESASYTHRAEAPELT
jgi:hypothetical protein